MQTLNRDYYTGWSEIPDDAVRFWVRLWQDGFHSGSHPEWAFNPLTLTGLGLLWRLFAPIPAQRDWGRSQRHAIRILASRRGLFPDGIRFPSPKSDVDYEWDQYWTKVLDSGETFRAELFEQLSSLVCSTGDPDYRGISQVTAVLAGELLLAGYSDYELFIRTGGIIDPRREKTLPHQDRARGLLDHLKRKPTYEYMVRTNVLLRSGASPSSTIARRIARHELAAPEEWKGSNGFVRVPGALLAMSRIESTHSITAFLNHRVSAWQSLRHQSTKFGFPGLALAESSFVNQIGAIPSGSWRHTLPRTSAFERLPRPNPVTEARAFVEAIEAVNDDPEEAIRVLSDAFERQLGAHWPQPAARCYINGLRSALARILATVVQETKERWGGDPDAPTWLQGIPADSRLDFAQVASAIRQAGRHADWLLAERFDSVNQAGTHYLTPAWITGWLYLAKGIRNREVHAGSLPLDLRCVASFLARVLLHVFVSTFPVVESRSNP